MINALIQLCNDCCCNNNCCCEQKTATGLDWAIVILMAVITLIAMTFYVLFIFGMFEENKKEQNK